MRGALGLLLIVGAGCNAILGLDEVEPLASNGTCDAPTALTLPATVNGDTEPAADVLSPCFGEQGREAVFGVTAPASGMLFAEVTGSADFRLALLRSCEPAAPATTCCSARGEPDCDDSAIETCVCALDSTCCEEEWDAACVEQAARYCGAACDPVSCASLRAEYEQLIVPVVEGQQYLLMVEGTAPESAGAFTLAARMLEPCSGACTGNDSCQFTPAGTFCLPDGDACENLATAALGPQEGDTTGGSAYYSGSCAGHGFVPGYATGPENTFTFVPPADGNLTIELDSSAELYLHVRGGCEASDTELACSNAGTTNTVTLPVLASDSYTIIVDTLGAPGAYTLTLTLD